MMTTTTTIQARRPGPAPWLRMFQAEAKMILREPMSLLLPLGLPLLMLLAMGTVFLPEPDKEAVPGVTVFDVYVLPLVIAVVVATVALINLPGFLGTYRKTKILRRLAVTPASPAMVLVAQVVVSFLQVLLGIALSFVVGALVFSINPPIDLFMAVLALLTLSAAMYALGMLITSTARTPNAANAIGFILFMLFAALGGVFGPIEMLPSPLDDIGAWLPFGAGVEALQSAWAGETIDRQNWVSLAATTILGLGVAASLFRWE